MSIEQRASVDVASGHLVLAPSGAQTADALTGAVIAQRSTSGDYVATALVNTRGLGAGAHAGLAAYSWREEAVGVAVGGGRIFAWRREGKDQQTSASQAAPDAPAIYLRMIVTGGEQFRFAYSVNGRDWKELGGAVAGSHVEGAHVALTAGGATTGARFDWFKITYGRAEKKD
jgi:hypothetical protein